MEFIHGLATGRFTEADIDRTDHQMMNIMATAVAILIERKAAPGRPA